MEGITTNNLYTSTSRSQSSKRRASLTDSGNSVPQSPMRFENSGRTIRQIDGLLDVVNQESSSSENDSDSDNDDNINDNQQADDENDDQQADEEDTVNIRLPIVDSYGDKGNYEGSVLRTSLHEDLPIPTGSGTMQYADGRVYKGKWKDGQWDGHGSTRYPNGDTYEGDYEADQRHGIGIYKWRDGRIFQGNFRNDQRNGHGVYKWPDGSTYVGDFLEGQRHGEGTYSVSTTTSCMTFRRRIQE